MDGYLACNQSSKDLGPPLWVQGHSIWLQQHLRLVCIKLPGMWTQLDQGHRGIKAKYFSCLFSAHLQKKTCIHAHTGTYSIAQQFLQSILFKNFLLLPTKTHTIFYTCLKSKNKKDEGKKKWNKTLSENRVSKQLGKRRLWVALWLFGPPGVSSCQTKSTPKGPKGHSHKEP